MKKVFCSPLLRALCLACAVLLFPAARFLPAVCFLRADALTPTAPAVDAAAYILMEAHGGTVLAGRNERLALPPASTTKIMTCLLTLERCAPEETATVPEEACRVEGSSAYLRKGEVVTVGDLLYMLMLRSANDAAVTLAYHVAGGCEQFAALMNEKAKKLSLKNTHFVNPHGLPEKGHLASAEDLALLACAALENPSFRKIVSTKNVVVGKEENARALTNHNRLLFSLDGCIGVKTGYTVEAGRCLVSACERNGTRLIAVTLSCRGDWAAHTALYAYGFSTVRRYTLAENSFSLPAAGAGRSVEVGHGSYDLTASPDDSVEFIPVCPQLLTAPIEKGEQIGFVSVRLNGREIARVAITAKEDLGEPVKKSFWAKLLAWLGALFKKK